MNDGRGRSVAGPLARVAAGLALLSPPALAQSFSYPDFSDITGLTLNGNAAQVGDVLRVTAAVKSHRGSFYFDAPVSVAGGFYTTFTLRVSDPKQGGADGMTFILQSSAAGLGALGDNGSALGYADNGTVPAIENCLVVEFDTWQSGKQEIDDNHVSVHTGGTSPNDWDEAFSLGAASVPTDMSDGAVHTAVVRYAGGTLEVFVDDLSTPLLSIPWDFATGGQYTDGSPAGGLDLIDGHAAYVGFTAGCGDFVENHDVLSWDWGGGAAGTNYCGPASLNSSGASAVISGAGSDLVAANWLSLTAESLPTNQFGYFLTSETKSFVPFAGGSQGHLCLGGSIGRYNRPGEVADSGAGGSFSLALDLGDTPQPNGSVAIAPGETWNFQAWFRDVNPLPTSNFTDGLSVLFR